MKLIALIFVCAFLFDEIESGKFYCRDNLGCDKGLYCEKITSSCKRKILCTSMDDCSKGRKEVCSAKKGYCVLSPAAKKEIRDYRDGDDFWY